MSQKNTIPMKVVNMSDEEVLLRRGTTLAIGYPVTDIIDVGLEQQIINQVTRQSNQIKSKGQKWKTTCNAS